MQLISSLGIILILLIHTTTSSIYYVTPEGDDITATVESYTLQYYINNSLKYFTSHTQLQFFVGTHYSYSKLVVQNVTNFSLVGSQTTVIYSQYATILMNFVENITISNIMFINEYSVQLPILLLANCSNVFIQDSVFTCHSKNCYLIIADAFKVVILHNVSSDSLIIWHNESISDCNTTVSKYTGQSEAFSIHIELHQHDYNIKILLSQLNVNINSAVSLRCTTCKGTNLIKLEKTTFTGIMSKDSFIVFVQLKNCGEKLGDRLATIIHIDECHFTEIEYAELLIQIYASQTDFLSRYSIVSFTNCMFYKIKSLGILTTVLTSDASTLWKPRLTINIQNTTLSRLTAEIVLSIKGADLILSGPVIFTEIKSYGLISTKDSQIYLQHYVELSLNQVFYFFGIRYIILKENSKLNISKNAFTIILSRKDNEMSVYREGHEDFWCVFQYINMQKQKLTFKNYSILLRNNTGTFMADERFSISHCDWIDDSTFMQLNSEEVNKEVIQLVNNSFTPDGIMNNYICYCTDHQYYDCTADVMGPVYPGQTYMLNFTVTEVLKSDVFIKFDDRPITACKSQDDIIDIHLSPNTCHTVTYNIQRKNAKDCEIYIRGIVKTPPTEPIKVISNWKFVDAFRIKIRPCPLGFMLNKIAGICQCDLMLSSCPVSVTTCNINDQTILRPANSWIIGKTNSDDSHTYQVSQRCPLDYCLPHSSYLDLSNPDSQCQFDRAGLLCGQCEKGLSAMFGTSKCQECSNTFLLLVFAFASAGIIFVMGLFISNFTVTSGSINGLTFYANIVSINTALFFQRYQSTKFTYTFVSLINLDLGIETCFYNGMDDYAKMWLQLLFPLYLILIAIMLIIGSRYSTRLQRLTARRALPVLATLFLLSYTKILRTVSSVLFSYSTITNLPSNHTMLVWLIDTKTQIFGLKFTLLFIVSIILFITLLLFNAILLFTKTFIRFKRINKFKPLLDAYLGPYQDKFYYWTGLQLLLRAVFFGISALERITNIMISIILLGVMECIYSKECPLRIKSKNYMEILLLLNLQVMFVSSWYNPSNAVVVNIMVTLAFVTFTCSILKDVMISKQTWNSIAGKIVKIAGYFRFMQSQPVNMQHDIELRNRIPEVKYNYKQFQEPLIGLDS